MCPTTWKFFSAILLCVSFYAFGQESDSPQKDFSPTGIRVGTDMIAIGRTLSGGKFEGWEVNADVDFYKYLLAVDYGTWAKSLTLPTGVYANSGNYFRVGSDVNFLANNRDEIMLFIGLRYGQSKFDEEISYTSEDPNLGLIENRASNKNVIGRWAELTSGLRVKVWKGLWVGYTARFKARPRYKDHDVLVPYDIPGYGLAVKKNYWGFNYQLFWRISLRSP